MDELRESWASLLEDASFFFKLKHIYRFYKKNSNKQAKAIMKEDLNTRANVELATATLHEHFIVLKSKGKLVGLRVHWMGLSLERPKWQQFALELSGNK